MGKYRIRHDFKDLEAGVLRKAGEIVELAAARGKHLIGRGLAEEHTEAKKAKEAGDSNADAAGDKPATE